MEIISSDSVRIDQDYMEKYLECLRNRAKGIEAFAGFNQVGTLRPGMTYLLAGRPSMGKTTLALDMLRFIAVDQGIPSVYFSLNATKETTLKCLLSMSAHIDLNTLCNNDMNDETWQKVTKAAKALENGNIILNDTCPLSVDTIDSELDNQLFEDVKVVFIDYLQLLENYISDRVEYGTARIIAEKIKKIAERRNIAIVVLSSLSRAVEKGDDHRPRLLDVFNSGIPADCFDVIMTLYRDDYYYPDTGRPSYTEVGVLKNRVTGHIGQFQMIWNPAAQTLTNAL